MTFMLFDLKTKNLLNIFWFRRDLRIEDNAGLYHALSSGLPVQTVFIFDKNILDSLPKKSSFLKYLIRLFTQKPDINPTHKRREIAQFFLKNKGYNL